MDCLPDLLPSCDSGIEEVTSLALEGRWSPFAIARHPLMATKWFVEVLIQWLIGMLSASATVMAV
jgi:hypothetical protein